MPKLNAIWTHILKLSNVLVVAMSVSVAICKLAVDKLLGLLWGHVKKNMR